MNKSRTSSMTSSGLALGLSILLTTTSTFFLRAKAFDKTKRVWGMAPSKASTSSRTPSTMSIIRSTSPPKSAWPGVSTMFIFVSPYMTEVFLERIVMPLSRSRSLLSITLSSTCSLSLNMPLCFKSWSTRVVLPWSTWAMIAIFLISLISSKLSTLRIESKIA